VGATGVRLGHLAGASVDFKDYREYHPGDDLRRIDWNIFARSDKLIVKLYREEVNPHLDLVLDGSRSMALPDSEKARALLGVAAVLAVAAANSQCSHAAWQVASGVRPVGHGSDRPSLWEGVELQDATAPAETFAVPPATLRRRGIRVLISDLLWSGDPLLTLRPLVHQAAALIVVQLLAEADLDPPVRGNTRLVDVESGRPMEVFVDALAEKRYREALSRHQQNWDRACRQVGANMMTLVAERIVGHWRLPALEAARFLDPL